MDVDLTILIQLVLFIGMLMLLNRLVFRHFLELIEKRHNRLYDSREQAETLDQRASGDQEAYQTRIREARSAGQREREGLRKTGQEEQRRKVNEARSEVNQTLNQAREEIDGVEKQAQGKLEMQADDLAALLVDKIAGRGVA